MPYQVLTNQEPVETVLDLVGDEVEFHVWDPNDQDLAAKLPEIEGVYLYGLLRVTRELMDKMPALKVVCTTSVGYDHIDVEAARERGIAVGHTPHVLSGAVADMAFALMLSLTRNVLPANEYAHGSKFTAFLPEIFMGHEVHDSTIGIVGLGNIGKEIAKRAHGFDMNILYYDIRQNPAIEEAYGAQFCALNELFQHADYVVLMVPLTKSTYHLIGEEQLRLMKPTAELINISRGGVLDHKALYKALTEGWIRGAALDVTEPEPLPRDHPLLELDNLIITPHLGTSTWETRDAMLDLAIRNLLAGLRGEPMPARAV